jgi:hypothetical protein
MVTAGVGRPFPAAASLGVARGAARRSIPRSTVEALVLVDDSVEIEDRGPLERADTPAIALVVIAQKPSDRRVDGVEF